MSDDDRSLTPAEQAEVDQLEAAQRDGAARAERIAAQMAEANKRFLRLLAEGNEPGSDG
jgi:hypothetical protein